MMGRLAADQLAPPRKRIQGIHVVIGGVVGVVLAVGIGLSLGHTTDRGMSNAGYSDARDYAAEADN